MIHALAAFLLNLACIIALAVMTVFLFGAWWIR